MTGRPSPRARAGQWLLLAASAGCAWYLAHTAAANLRRHDMGFGFGFLLDRANFDIPFRLIAWHEGDTYLRALLLCTLNTLLVSALAIAAASAVGLVVGVMRLSHNWLVRHIALAFVELLRNTPQLVQIIFWYVAVLQALPGPRQSLALPFGALLNVRGLYLPVLHAGAWTGPLAWLAVAALAGALVLWRRLGARGLLAPALLAAAALGDTAGFDRPVLRGFNIAGGVQVPPELVALWAGLSLYAAAFIAEIVRAAILSVDRGQREAALSLGLRPAQVLRRVVLPQALRVVVPPLTSQYLNIIKSSSLGAAVAYPELFQIFAGTVLNQSGREMETIVILMAIFLAISLLTSAGMNWYNRRVALVGR